MNGEPRSGGSDGKRRLDLSESHVVTIEPMVGGGIYAALEFVVEIAGHLVVWLPQNRPSRLPIAVGVASALAPGRFSFTRLQAAKT